MEETRVVLNADELNLYYEEQVRDCTVLLTQVLTTVIGAFLWIKIVNSRRLNRPPKNIAETP